MSRRSAVATVAFLALIPATARATHDDHLLRPTGCTASHPGWVTGAMTSHRLVALTFDDGPNGNYTRAIIRILRRERVPATFFLIGRQIPAERDLVRRELLDGFLLGDHTWDHADVTAGSSYDRDQIVSTRREIRRASGFETCVMRPPYGRVSPALFSLNDALGLDTVTWNVDPRDWSLPGTGAIVSTIRAEVRPGSIVLMHDGGGNRSETVAALPQVIHTLRHDGYRLVGLERLLHLRMRY